MSLFDANPGIRKNTPSFFMDLHGVPNAPRHTSELTMVVKRWAMDTVVKARPRVSSRESNVAWRFIGGIAGGKLTVDGWLMVDLPL